MLELLGRAKDAQPAGFIPRVNTCCVRCLAGAAAGIYFFCRPLPRLLGSRCARRDSASLHKSIQAHWNGLAATIAERKPARSRKRGPEQVGRDVCPSPSRFLLGHSYRHVTHYIIHMCVPPRSPDLKPDARAVYFASLEAGPIPQIAFCLLHHAPSQKREATPHPISDRKIPALNSACAAPFLRQPLIDVAALTNHSRTCHPPALRSLHRIPFFSPLRHPRVHLGPNRHSVEALSQFSVAGSGHG